MAKQAAWKANLTVNSVALEGSLNDITLDVTQETPVVTGFVSTGPERVAGNYDYNMSVAGQFNPSTTQIDATIFGLLGSTGFAIGFDPTGASAGAQDPNYDFTALLGSYQIKAAVGAAVTISAGFVGNSALTRSTA